MAPIFLMECKIFAFDCRREKSTSFEVKRRMKFKPHQAVNYQSAKPYYSNYLLTYHGDGSCHKKKMESCYFVVMQVIVIRARSCEEEMNDMKHCYESLLMRKKRKTNQPSIKINQNDFLDILILYKGLVGDDNERKSNYNEALDGEDV